MLLRSLVSTNIFGLLIFLCLEGCTQSASEQPSNNDSLRSVKGFCSEYEISLIILEHDSDRKLIPSELWNQTNPLRSPRTREIPDTIWIGISVLNNSRLYSSAASTPINLSVSATLVFSLLPDCVELVNPKSLDSIKILPLTTIADSDFSNSNSSDWLELTSKPIDLGQLILEAKQKFGYEFMGQIVLEASMKSPDGKFNCLIRKTHHTCTSAYNQE